MWLSTKQAGDTYDLQFHYPWERQIPRVLVSDWLVKFRQVQSVVYRRPSHPTIKTKVTCLYCTWYSIG